MRVSTYEIILPLIDRNGSESQEHALLANGIYGAFDVIPKEAASKIVAGDIAALAPALQERLLRRGHITNKDAAAERDDALLIARLSAKLVTDPRIVLFVMPTYDCNFRCPYCFERKRLRHGPEWLSKTMAPEMVEAIFRAVEHERNRGRHIESCTLFGGEPFLKENFAAVQKICQRAGALGIPLNAITNGYEIDCFRELLEQYPFRNLKIAVDGTGAAHDRHRRHKDGLPTYARIMDNIALALSKGVDVTLRININRENVGEIKKLPEDLAARGLMEPGKDAKGWGTFEYSFKAVEEADTLPTHMSEGEVLQAIIAADPAKDELQALEHESLYVNAAVGLRRAMTKKQLPYLTAGHCNAVKGKAIIDPYGEIFPCAYLLDDAGEGIGYVDEAEGRFLYNFRKAKWDARTGDILKPCQSCPYIFFCGGGCAMKAKKAEGNPFQHHCGNIREIWDYTAARVAADEWAKRGNEELTLSYAEPLSRLSASQRERLCTTNSRKEIFATLLALGFFEGKP